jgi:hypothetical protein
MIKCFTKGCVSWPYDLTSLIEGFPTNSSWEHFPSTHFLSPSFPTFRIAPDYLLQETSCETQVHLTSRCAGSTQHRTPHCTVYYLPPPLDCGVGFEGKDLVLLCFSTSQPTPDSQLSLDEQNWNELKPKGELQPLLENKKVNQSINW